MAIKRIMSTRLVTVQVDDPVSTVKEIFENVKFHHVLVVDNDKLVGIVSDRDLFKAISPWVGTDEARARDKACLTRRVHQIMSRKPICVSPDTDLRDVIKLFNHNRISCLPVVDDQGHAVGILSWRDILKIFEKYYDKRSPGHSSQLIPD